MHTNEFGHGDGNESEFELWRQKPFILWKFDIETRFKLLNPIPNSVPHGECVYFSPKWMSAYLCVYVCNMKRMYTAIYLIFWISVCKTALKFSECDSIVSKSSLSHTHRVSLTAHTCVCEYFDGLAYFTSNRNIIWSIYAPSSYHISAF